MPQVLTEFRFPPEFNVSGERWTTLRTTAYSLSEIRAADLVVINQDIRKALFAKSLRRHVIVVDVILRPHDFSLKHRLLRTAMNYIDYFIHYFRDVSGYRHFWNIGPDRSGYVPFKANLRGKYMPQRREGSYIVCFGQSCRDYDTYFAATQGLDAVMPFRDLHILRQHGSKITFVPPHVRVIQNDGTQKDCARILEGAKIVAVPIRADNICSSSIGTYLNAMYLGRPCVLTSGPGVSDVLTDQALIVPPGDARKLREAIQVLLTDDQLRFDLAGRGRRYAESLGGVEELGSRVRDEAMRWWYSQRKTSISPL
jgi:glycosyltransferase involved in cell wall biosynthesis